MVNRRLGILVRGDFSGLGNQTRRMTQLLRPEKLLYINSSSFSKNKEQHKEWYEGFLIQEVQGFPGNISARYFLKGLTHFICCENPHNFNFYRYARDYGVKSYCVVNYEFLDNLNHPEIAEPDYFIMPSHWKLEEMKAKYGERRVIYLPPPIELGEFTEARQENIQRKNTEIKFLHIVGTLAAHDRNGTLDLLEALKHTKAEFSLTIRSQHPLPQEYMTDDRRVTYIAGTSEKEVQNIYKGYDVLILPRRYGGLCLPCNEALASAMPVIMPDVSPNNSLLPKSWLVAARNKGQFMARTMIDYIEIEPSKLAYQIDHFVQMAENDPERFHDMKLEAFEIANNEFSNHSLRERYEELWQK